jgi:hypothetical protein
MRHKSESGNCERNRKRNVKGDSRVRGQGREMGRGEEDRREESKERGSRAEA